MSVEKEYRVGVVCVIINDQEQVLVGRRKGTNSWQFPQGGVDKGETLDRALLREVLEEVGSDKISIDRRGEKGVCYDFPKDLSANIARSYKGQCLYWFLCKPQVGFSPDLQKARDDEFDALAWWPISDVFAGVISWKKHSYKEGLRSIGLDHE